MASGKFATKLFYLANCSSAARRQAAAAAIKSADAAGVGKATECGPRRCGHEHHWNKSRTMASAAQELAPHEAAYESGHGRRGRGGFLQRVRSPLASLDLFDSFFPNKTLRSMVDTMDRAFEDPFFGHYSNRLRSAGPGGAFRSRAPWDFAETEDAFRMRLDMPGLSKEEVKVFVEDGSLVIKGEQAAAEEKAEQEAENAFSRSYNKYSTRIVLPETANAEQIKAELKNGVLSVTIPKHVEEEVKKNVIDVHIE